MSLLRDLAVATQYLLPHRLLSAAMYGLTRIRWRPLKNAMIRSFARYYAVDLDAAVSADPDAYPHFNAFFTRALKPQARPLEADPKVWLVPCDARVSQAGAIHDGQLLQAKGLSYTLTALLGSREWAETYAQGSFVTLYLSPRDYHRVHMPYAGRLLETTHIPGRLFSVAPWTTETIPGLFARNERLVCHFESEAGAFAVILVGAIFVSGIETTWSGVVTPPYAAATQTRDYRSREPRLMLERGAELGRFNMGSTVIVLSQRPLRFDPTVVPGRAVHWGRSLGWLD